MKAKSVILGIAIGLVMVGPARAQSFSERWRAEQSELERAIERAALFEPGAPDETRALAAVARLIWSKPYLFDSHARAYLSSYSKRAKGLRFLWFLYRDRAALIAESRAIRERLARGETPADELADALLLLRAAAPEGRREARAITEALDRLPASALESSAPPLCRELAHRRAEAARPILARLTGEDRPLSVRLAAGDALRRLGGPCEPVLEALRVAIKGYAISDVLELIKDLGPEAAPLVPFALQLVESGAMLNFLMSRVIRAIGPAAIPGLRRALLAAKEASFRGFLVTLLGDFLGDKPCPKAAIAALLEALDAAPLEERPAVIRQLTSAGADGAFVLDELEELAGEAGPIGDAARQARRSITRAIREAEAARLVPEREALLAWRFALDSPSGSEDEAWAVARARRFDPKAALSRPRLLAALDHPRRQARVARYLWQLDADIAPIHTALTAVSARIIERRERPRAAPRELEEATDFLAAAAAIGSAAAPYRPGVISLLERPDRAEDEPLIPKACAALEAIGGQASLPALRKRGADPHLRLDLRIRIARAILELAGDPEPALRLIRRALKIGDDAALTAAAPHIKALNDRLDGLVPAALERFRRHLTRVDERRLHRSLSLGARRLEPEALRSLLPILRRALRSSRDPALRDRIVEQLGGSLTDEAARAGAPALDGLIEALDDSAPKVVQRALKQLGALGKHAERALPKLRTLAARGDESSEPGLRFPEPRVVIQTIEAACERARVEAAILKDLEEAEGP